MSRDFRCPLRRVKGLTRLEWVAVARQGGGGVRPGAFLHGEPETDYEVPRVCMEALGIDCTPLDRRDERGRQGTVWIRSDQAEALRRHRHYIPADPEKGQQ